MVAPFTESHPSQNGFTTENFARTVLDGALRDRIRLLSNVIHIYTQIVSQQPAPAARCPAGDQDNLRDTLVTMRWNVAEMDDIIRGGGGTLPVRYTPAQYIASVAGALRRHAAIIQQCAAGLQADPLLAGVRLAALNGQTVGEMAGDILGRMTEVLRLIGLAAYYAERLRAD